MDEAREAFAAGKQAYREGVSPLDNPHAPAPPGDIRLCQLWRQGWQAAKRQGHEEGER